MPDSMQLPFSIGSHEKSVSIRHSQQTLPPSNACKIFLCGTEDSHVGSSNRKILCHPIPEPLLLLHNLLHTLRDVLLESGTKQPTKQICLLAEFILICSLKSLLLWGSKTIQGRETQLVSRRRAPESTQLVAGFRRMVITADGPLFASSNSFVLGG